jgi:hypothetical protein
MLGPLRRGMCSSSSPAAAVVSSVVAAVATAGLEPLSRRWGRGSQRCGALAMKCGMTHAWLPSGLQLPLTMVEVQDLQVVKAHRVPITEGEGLNLQLGGGWQKAKRINRAQVGQFESRGLPLKRYMREFRVSEDAVLPIGTSITARHFVAGAPLRAAAPSVGAECWCRVWVPSVCVDWSRRGEVSSRACVPAPATRHAR